MSGKDGGYPLPGNIDTQQTACISITVPNDAGFIAAAIGAISTTSKWFNWQRDTGKRGKDAAYRMLQAMQTITVVPGDCSKSKSSLTGGGCAAVTDDDEERDMPNLHMVRRNGVPMLMEICPCGEVEFYAVNRVTDDFDAGGVSPGPNFEVDAPSRDCFQFGATVLMLVRAGKYHKLTLDVSNLLFDALVALYGVQFNVADVLAEFALGSSSIETLRGYSHQDVLSALDADSVRDPLVSAWTFDVSPTREQLRQWALSAPIEHGGVPVRLLLTDWLKYSRLDNLVDELKLIYAGCKSGTGGGLPYDYYEKSVNGVIWPVWLWNDPATLEEVGDTFALSGPATNVQGVYYRADIPYTSGGGADFVKVGIDVGGTAVHDRQTGFQNSELDSGVFVSTSARAAASAVIAEAVSGVIKPMSGRTASVTMRQETVPDYSAVLREVLLVGEPYA